MKENNRQIEFLRFRENMIQNLKRDNNSNNLTKLKLNFMKSRAETPS